MQSVDAGVVVTFDLEAMNGTAIAGSGEIRTFVREVAVGWYLCAIGFHSSKAVEDLWIGICAWEADSYSPFHGFLAMGFDMTEPMSVAGIGLHHPRGLVDFSDNKEVSLTSSERTERILAKFRGRVAGKKLAIARAKPSPKLVVVGASSVMFGVRASVLERDLGIPAANCGVVAGLGLPGILQMAREILKERDICVLALELFFFIKGSWQPDGAHLDGNVEFDPWGDYLGNETKTVTEQMRARVESAPVFAHNWQYYFDSQGKCAAQLRAFGTWARDNGVLVFCSWPVMYVDSIEPARRLVCDIAEFYLSLGFSILGEPADTAYPLSWFYDTNNHLHSDAAIEHSRRMVLMLKRAGISCHA